MHTASGRTHRFIRKEPGLWLGVVLSASVGLLFYILTAKSLESDMRERFENVTQSAQYLIHARIRSYTNFLRSSASMFQTNNGLTRTQFHQYVDGLGLDSNLPGVESVNFSRQVSQAELPAYLAHLAADVASAPGTAPLHPSAPAASDLHEIVEYVEPRTALTGRIGYDLLSRPPVLKALTAARDTGGISASGSPLPVLSGPQRIGLGMRLPVYRNDLPHASVAERRRAYVGSVGISFSMPKLVEGVLSELQAPDVRLTMIDAQTGLLLFDSGDKSPHSRLAEVTPEGPFFLSVLPVDFNGHCWRAYFRLNKRDAYTGFDAWFPWVAAVAGFALSGLLYALFHALSSSRARAIRLAKHMTRELRANQLELELSHEKLRGLAARADQIKEDERKRIAREIHDDLGQNLLAVRIEADVLMARTAGRFPHLHARARDAVAQIDATIRSVRHIINDLRPNVLDLGLNAAVDWLIADFRRHNGVRCELYETNKEIRVDDHIATAFFRILQESLNNIARHANATMVWVDLRHEDSTLSMTVADNGRGIHPGARERNNSYGLLGIEERIKILGGSLAIDSVPGLGTTVRVAVVLPKPSEEEDEEARRSLRPVVDLYQES